MPGVELTFFFISGPIDMNCVHNGGKPDSRGPVSGACDRRANANRTTSRYALIASSLTRPRARRLSSSEQVAAPVALAKLQPWVRQSGGRVERSTLQIAILDKPLPNVDVSDRRCGHSDPNDGSDKGDAHEYLRKYMRV